MRGLIKAGDKKALQLIGFGKPSGIGAKLKLAPGSIGIGESVDVTATLHNNSRRKQNLLIDYIVYFQGKGAAERRKVFKWKTIELKAGEKSVLQKKHPMKVTTIRALYPGKHKIELQLNGEVVAGKHFELT